MASFINTNIASINAQRNLTTSQSALSTSLQRLSSGLRINSAKDDAAGLAITQRMTSQINGSNQAGRNANDGISLTQTAEGDLSTISTNLQRIRELAVQSSNASNSASDRAAINNEAATLIAENDRVASNSSFNGNKLLDGTFTSQSFQLGANNTSGDRIGVSIASAKSSSLGVGSSSSYSTQASGTAVNANALTAGGLVINGFNVGASTKDGVSFANSDASAIAKAAAINAVSAQTGVNATVSTTTVAGTALAAGAGGYGSAIVANDIQINGVDIGALTIALSAAERGSQMAAAINAKATQTGVTASFDVATGKVGLTAADGRNVSITRSSNAGATDVSTGLTTGTATITSGNTATTTLTGTIALSSSSKTGITIANGGSSTVATAGVAPTSSAATSLADGDLKINGVNVGTYGGSTTAAPTELAALINGNTALQSQGVVASVSGTGTAGRLVLTSASGAAINILAVGTATAATGFSTTNSMVAAGGAGAGATESGFTTGATTATATAGAGISSLDLTTAAGSQAALTTIDAALASVNSARDSLGAYQNRFASVVTTLQTSSENLSASRSRIEDTDFASETASLTRGQILQQAGTAMLAQANSLPNGVLALLRG